MKRILLSAALLAGVACARRDRLDDAPNPRLEPSVGTKQAVFVVLDERDRTRLGYVEKWAYGPSGVTLYWVFGLDRSDKLGYVSSAGRAIRYDYPPGGRVETDLGADTVAMGVRRILRHEAPVVVERTTEKALAEEFFAAKRAAEAPPEAERAGVGGGGVGGSE
jgi:hypothetical protein